MNLLIIGVGVVTVLIGLPLIIYNIVGPIPSTPYHPRSDDSSQHSSEDATIACMLAATTTVI